MTTIICPACGLRLKRANKKIIFCRCGTRFTAEDGLPLPQLTPADVVITGNPGGELFLLFQEIDVREKPECNCKSIAAEMDREGVAGCRAKREYFVAKLKQNAHLYSLWEKAMIAPAILWQGKPWTLEGMFDEAVDRAEAKERAYLAKLLAEFAAPALPRDQHWRYRRDVIAAQKQYLAQLVNRTFNLPGGFEGRGIVTLGGTAKYFGAAYVLVYLLRKLGCTLPAEWWFLGPEEFDPRMLELAEQLGNVQCVNLFERTGKYGRQPRRVGGWEAKAWAIMYSRFAEVLFLDADNVPTADPGYLFDEPAYLAAGTLAWPDFAPMGWSVTEPAFQIAGLAIPGRTACPDWRAPTDYRPWETGQLLVDKQRAWHALEVWAALSDQSDFWYPREFKGQHWYVYGDKDLAYLAWEVTKTPYAMPPDCYFAGDDAAGAFMQKDPAGKLVFQHRVQPAVKWKLHEPNREVPGSRNHAVCLAALDQLRTLWTGQVWDAHNETASEREAAAELVGDYVWFHQGEPTRLSLLPGGRINGEWHWTLRQIRGENWLFLSTFDRRVAVLGRDNHDLWTWCNHGTNDFLMASPPADFDLPLKPDEVVIWHEVVLGNEYRLADQLSASDVFLDIGGHCGMFAHACLSRGAGRVVTVEPVPENFARLEGNLRRYDASRVRAINAAAWHLAGRLFLEQKPGAHHTGGWSAIGTMGGLAASTITMDELLDICLMPGIDSPRLHVKLDCEGSEWPILEHFTRWSDVASWCGEYHLANCPHRDGIAWLRQCFASHGFQVVMESHPAEAKLGHFWAMRS